LANALKSRALSPVELLEDHIARIERLNPVLNAFLTLTFEQARSSAAAAEAAIMRGEELSPLHGIPIAHKDIYFTKGVRTTAGSLALDQHVPGSDAAVVERLAAVGAISLGKTHCHELACGAMEGYGVTRNPWDPARAAGGSSSGSAAAVAGRLAVAATASDTGGSVRVPAAFTGTVGLKPTFGRISRHGMFPISYSLDHPAILTNSVEDAELVFRELAGPDARDRSTLMRSVEDLVGADVRGTPIRVGLPGDLLRSGVASDVAAALAVAARRFEDIGAVTVEVELEGFDLVAPVHAVVWLAEAASRLRELLVGEGTRVGSVVRRRLRPGFLLSASDYFVAMHQRERLREGMARVFASVDVLLLPTAPFPAHLIDDVVSARSDVSRFNRLANLTGQPALAMPCGLSAAGLPLGLQLVAGHGREGLLLGVARAVEQATDWHRARPAALSTAELALAVADGRAEAYLDQLTAGAPPAGLPAVLDSPEGRVTLDWVRLRAAAADLPLTEPELVETGAQFHGTRLALDGMHKAVDGPGSTATQDFLA